MLATNNLIKVALYLIACLILPMGCGVDLKPFAKPSPRPIDTRLLRSEELPHSETTSASPVSRDFSSESSIPSKPHFEVGVNLGPPSILNIIFAYTTDSIDGYGFHLSGMYWDQLNDGLEAGLFKRFSSRSLWAFITHAATQVKKVRGTGALELCLVGGMFRSHIFDNVPFAGGSYNDPTDYRAYFGSELVYRNGGFFFGMGPIYETVVSAKSPRSYFPMTFTLGVVGRI